MLEPIWPERFEKTCAENAEEMRSILHRPNTVEIDAEVASHCAEAARGKPWIKPEHIADAHTRTDVGLTFGDYQWGTTAYDCDPSNPWVFEELACVQDYLGRVAKLANKFAVSAASYDPVQHEYQLLHAPYLFKKAGKRVYVLDRKLYDLFKYTDLPAWDFSTIRFPYPCFYIKFPPNVFHFGVSLSPVQDFLHEAVGAYSTAAQEAEGVFVKSYYNPNGSVEFGLVTTGKSKLDAGDDNVAHVQTGVGPHAKLNEIILSPNAAGKFTLGSEKLDSEVPHIVLSLMLYLASDHPDIVPVEAPKPRKFGDIRSPREREAALKNEAEKFKNISRLGYLHIGPRLRTLEQRKSEFEAATGRSLTRGHMVSQDTGGHWKLVAHGPGRQLRKIMHIAPYWRGPDYAEEMEIRAAKVQTGEKRKK